MDEFKIPEFYAPKTIVPIDTRLKDDNQHAKTPFKPNPPFVSIGSELPAKKSLLERLRLKKSVPKTPSPIVQLSSEHGRSLIDSRINRHVLWGGDLPADIYGSIDYKGTNMELPVVTHDEYSPYGFRAEGLKDNVGLQRIHAVSSLLRSNSLPTESIIRTYIIKEVYDFGKAIPIETWKHDEIQRRLDEGIHLRKAGFIDQADEIDKSAKEVADYLKLTEFYIVERQLQTAERLRDIRRATNESDFRGLIEPVFKWVNVVFETKKSGVIPGTAIQERFQYTQDDIARYFGDWLPSQMGIYLARMHKLEIAHGYPHAQNWSAVGTLYDLDSVHGRPLGDQPPTELEYCRDTKKTAEAILELLNSPAYRCSYMKDTFPDLWIKGESSFIASNISERYGKVINSDQIQQIRQNNFSDLKDLDNKTFKLPDEVWELVYSKLQIS